MLTERRAFVLSASIPSGVAGDQKVVPVTETRSTMLQDVRLFRLAGERGVQDIPLFQSFGRRRVGQPDQIGGFPWFICPKLSDPSDQRETDSWS